MTKERGSAEVGNRLYKIRHALGYGDDGQQKVFALKVLRIRNDLYSAQELGKAEFRVIYANRLLDEWPALSLDWIYNGDYRSVPLEAKRRLDAAPDKPLSRRGRRPRKSLDAASSPSLFEADDSRSRRK